MVKCCGMIKREWFETYGAPSNNTAGGAFSCPPGGHRLADGLTKLIRFHDGTVTQQWVTIRWTYRGQAMATSSHLLIGGRVARRQ